MNPYIGQIDAVAFPYPPRGWALCNGQLLSIASNAALFAILGTQYGGDGRTTFGLPDLRGRVPRHLGSNQSPGSPGGSEGVKLDVDQMPPHQHQLVATQSTADSDSPQNNVPATPGRSGTLDIYAKPPQALVPLDPTAIGLGGQGQAHDNMQPYLTLNFIIALEGIFPPHN